MTCRDLCSESGRGIARKWGSGHVADAEGQRVDDQVCGRLGALPVLAGDDLAGAHSIWVKIAQRTHIDAVHLRQTIQQL
jgi:hypothetical protein